ncbi:MAG: prtC [Rhizobium sp.]|nr:prtC [Rhizobium sp.]
MSLMGKTLKYDYFYPERNTPAEFDFGQGDITVKDGVEVTNSFYTMDVADTYMRFEFKDTGLFKLANFSGPVLEDIDGEVNPFSRFALLTNMHGLDRSDIKLTEDGIYINWQGASLTSKTYVQITFSFADNEVFGSSLDDDLIGTDDADRIKGRAGNDILRSDAAGDMSFAKAASHTSPVASDADKLYGGAGIDTFVFATGDSARKHANADTIFDFNATAGEIIDLSEWDAVRREAGDQSFDFIGRHDFSGHAGELRYVMGRSDAWIEGDTNGDGRADFTIHLDDGVNLRAGNFEL